MKIATLFRMLSVLSPARWMTVEQVRCAWERRYEEAVTSRSIQRYVKQMAAEGGGGDGRSEMPVLALRALQDGIPVYRLNPDEVSRWLMSEDLALELLVNRAVAERVMKGLTDGNAYEYAEAIADTASERVRRLRSRIRVVPDGIGRLPAHVDAGVLGAVIDAIASQRQLQIQYVAPDQPPVDRLMSPLGLVAKDGTLYLVATRGYGESPTTYALQRVRTAQPDLRAAIQPHGFDLDRHIRATHQFSHPFDANERPVALRLRVAPQAMYHFRERPLSENQEIIGQSPEDRWFEIRAVLPQTMLLVPFILSMGAGVQVLEPEGVREEVLKRARETAALYGWQEAAGGASGARLHSARS
jgi:predicted DNA-binding transcriptional regulator YafY